MTPTQTDAVIAAIRTRYTRLAWSPEVWADFRAAMLKIRIDEAQGVAAVANVVLTTKTVPGPAHFLEAFKTAQGERQATAPARAAETPGPANWHPRAWSIVRGWQWLWDEKNWPEVPAMLQRFAERSGWLPSWEVAIDPLRVGEFTSAEIAELGLWVRGQTRQVMKTERDIWAESQREAQARRVWIIAELRKQAARDMAAQAAGGTA